MNKLQLHIFFTLSLLITSALGVKAQQLKLGNNPTELNKVALLELESGNQGLRLTRVDTSNINSIILTLSSAQKDSINGMIVYQTKDSSLYIRTGNHWKKLALADSLGVVSINGLTNSEQTFTLDLGGSSPSSGFTTNPATGEITLHINTASTGRLGIVSTGRQTWNGEKRFKDSIGVESLSPGSIPFIGSDNYNYLSEDNSRLFWDNTNHRLGIGTNTPGYLLDVNGNAHFQDSLLLGKDLLVDGTSGNNGQILRSRGIGRSPIWEVLGLDSLSDVQLSAPANGDFLKFDGTNWVNISGGNNGTFWSLTGNSGTNPATDFLGTTNDQPLIFKVNSKQIGFLSTDSLIFGADAKANGADAIAIGSQSQATNASNIALGKNAKANSGNLAVAIGDNSSATGQASIALGSYYTKAGGHDAIAIGSSSNAEVLKGVAIGGGHAHGGSNAIAIGNGADAATVNSVALGNGAGAMGTTSTALGNNTSAGYVSTAVGNNADGSGAGAVAVGVNTVATGHSTVAIGDGTKAPGSQAVSIGKSANAQGGTGSIALGSGSSANGDDPNGATAIGIGATATWGGTLALGQGATATGLANKAATAIGFNATASKEYAIALGQSATASSPSGTAVGQNAQATNNFATAIGAWTTASGFNATAIGRSAKAPKDNTLILGDTTNIKVGILTGNPQYGLDVDGTGHFADTLALEKELAVSNGIGTSGQVLVSQGTGSAPKWQNASGGTVTSVGLALPSIFSVTGSPVTSSGTLTGTLTTQTANTIFAGPATGAAATPTFRALVLADLPAVAIADLSDVTTSSPTAGDVLSFNGTDWVNTSGSGTYWSLTGNSISSGDFLGTTNDQPLIFKTNGTRVGYLGSNADHNIIWGNGAAVSGANNNTVAIGYNAATKAENTIAIGASSNAGIPGSIAIGLDANAHGADAGIAIGQNAETNGSNNGSPLAIGYNAKATWIGSVALGQGATASGTADQNHATALGYNSNANGKSATALGDRAIANKDQVIAAGSNSTASGPAASAFGFETEASGDYATALGSQTTASGASSTAIGRSANANGQEAIAIGHNAKAPNNISIAIGHEAKTENEHTVAIGENATASSNYGTAVGRDAKAEGGYNSSAFGRGAKAKSSSAIAIGNGTAEGSESIAIGNNSSTTKNYSVAIGGSAVAKGVTTTAVGASAKANEDNATALGIYAHANSSSSIAIGDHAIAWDGSGTSYNTIAIGHNAKTNWDDNTIAIGYNALGQGRNSVTIGTGTGTSGAAGKYSIALGYHASTAGGGGDANDSTIAIGVNTNTKKASAIAIGSSASATGDSSVAIGANAYAPNDNTFILGNKHSKIGIHTNNPQYELDVNGTGHFSDALTLEKDLIANGSSGTSGQVLTSQGIGAAPKWQNVSSIGANNFWSLTGNSGTTPGTDFLGTTDDKALVFKTNNTQVGFLGSGTNYNVIFGNGATIATGVNTAVAIGYQAQSNAESSVAVGKEASALATNPGNIAIGFGAKVEDGGSYSVGSTIAIGINSYSNQNTAIAIGKEAKGYGFQSIAIGYKAKADNKNNSIAIGTNAHAAGQSSVAIGKDAYAQYDNTIALGGNSMGVVVGGSDAHSNALFVNGNIQYTGSSTQSSDRRFKKDLKNLQNVLAVLDSLHGYTYFFRTKEFKNRNFSSKKQIGMIAQEIEKYFPELVSTDDDGYKSLNYSQFTAVLLEAVKEQQTEIEQQQAKIKQLKEQQEKMKTNFNAKFKALSQRLDALEK